jgi:hypothetical protein
LIPGKDKGFSVLRSVQTASSPHPQPPAHWVLGAFSRGQSGWEVKLTTHIYLVLSAEVRNGGGIPPLPHMPSRYSAELHN